MNYNWGIVVSIKDPAQAQRVKVRLYGIYDNVPDDDLPWCPILRSATDALTFNIGKSSHNLMEGTQVLCGWLDDNFQQPIVLGSVPRIVDCDTNKNLDIQRIYTKQGHLIIIDSDKVEITDNKENSIKLDKDGISIKAAYRQYPEQPVVKGQIKEESHDKEIKIDNDFNISCINCNITCSGETKIDASNLSLKNIKGPNQFCKIPACLFTGAPHISPSTEG